MNIVTNAQLHKPCPWCGSDASIWRPDSDDYEDDCIVECVGCHVTSMIFANEAEAWQFWDTRAEQVKNPLTATITLTPNQWRAVRYMIKAYLPSMSDGEARSSIDELETQIFNTVEDYYHL